MTNEIATIDPKEFGLQETQVTEIQAAFMPKIVERDGLAEIYSGIITQEICPELCKTAKELRLKLVKVRTGIAEIHKTQKAFYLAAGRYVDAWKNKETLPVTQMEENLSAIEEHYERIEAQKRAALQTERAAELQKYSEEGAFIPSNLGELLPEVWGNYLLGVKTAYETKKENERKAAEAEAKRVEEEKAEQERIRQENERLKAEAEQREKERKELEAKAEAERKAQAERERKEREAHEAALKAERDEKERIQRELEAKAEAERKAQAERERKEREAHEAALKAERDEKERIQCELEAKAEAERKAQAERERKEREAHEAALKAERDEKERIQRELEAKAEAERKAQAERERKEREAHEAALKAERDEKERIQRELEAKAESERKAAADAELAKQAELAKGDSDKVKDLISDLIALKTKYTFQSKKNQKMYSDVGLLLDKAINFVKS